MKKFVGKFVYLKKKMHTMILHIVLKLYQLKFYSKILLL